MLSRCPLAEQRPPWFPKPYELNPESQKLQTEQLQAMVFQQELQAFLQPEHGIRVEDTVIWRYARLAQCCYEDTGSSATPAMHSEAHKPQGRARVFGLVGFSTTTIEGLEDKPSDLRLCKQHFTCSCLETPAAGGRERRTQHSIYLQNTFCL